VFVGVCWRCDAACVTLVCVIERRPREIDTKIYIFNIMIRKRYMVEFA